LNKNVMLPVGGALLLFASMDAACVSDSGTPDSGTDAGVDAAPDVTQQEAAADAPSEATADVVDAAPKIPEIYAVVGGGFQNTPTSIEVIDVAQKKAVRDNTISGIVALAYRKGSLYAVRGGGQSRISVIDPVTLLVTSTITLAWDPTAAVFSADGATVYIARGAGYVEQVKLPAGSLTGETQVPSAAGGTIQAALGMALNNAETQVGLTFFNGAQSTVATVDIAGATLSVGHNIVPPGIDGSNCGRENSAIAYSVDDVHVTTLDANCGTIDAYMASSLVRDDVASAQFARPSAVGSGSIVYDNAANAWAANYDTIYRAPTNNAANKTAFASTTVFWNVLFEDTTRSTLYATTYDMHNNGIWVVATDGGTTRQLWDLSLVPQNLGVVTAIYVER